MSASTSRCWAVSVRMTASDTILSAAAQRLLRSAPGPDWWPGRPWTVAISAVLVQQTTWTQAWRAVERLGKAGVSPEHLLALPDGELGVSIRCSGFWRRKVRTLQQLAETWETLATATPPARRMRLLDLTGIGPETADAICCYAFGEATLVIDAMTARLTSRLTGEDIAVRDYDALQQRWTLAMPVPDNLNCKRLHAAIVEHSRTICRPRSPACSDCALRTICTTGNSTSVSASQ